MSALDLAQKLRGEFGDLISESTEFRGEVSVWGAPGFAADFDVGWVSVFSVAEGFSVGGEIVGCAGGGIYADFADGGRAICDGGRRGGYDGAGAAGADSGDGFFGGECAIGE